MNKKLLLCALMAFVFVMAIGSARPATAMENYYSSGADGTISINSVGNSLHGDYIGLHENTNAYDLSLTSEYMNIGQTNFNYPDYDDTKISRGYLFFENTGDIADNAVIIGARLRVAIDYATTSDRAIIVYVQNTSAVAPLDNSEFNVAGFSGNLGQTTVTSSMTSQTVVSIILNADGRAAIDKTGTTNFGLRIDWDVSATPPRPYDPGIGHKNDTVSFFSSNYLLKTFYGPRLDLVFDNDDPATWPSWFVGSDPVLAISPSSGIIGTTVTFTGENFTPNAIVYIRYTYDTNVQSVTTSSSTGTFTKTYQIHTTGTTSFYAIDSVTSAQTNIVTFTENGTPAGAPVISINPPSGPDNTLITFSGTNVTPNTNVYLYNLVLQNTVSSATSDNEGNFSITYNIDSANGTVQSFSVFEYGGVYWSNTVSFTIVGISPPAITLSSSSGPSGQTINISGTRFTPNSAVWLFGYSYNYVSPSGPTLGSMRFAIITAGDNGTFSYNYTIPSNLPVMADVISAYDPTAQLSAVATYNITSTNVITPTLTISPSSTTNLTPTITFIGQGFTPGGGISIINGSIVFGTPVADNNGYFSIALTVPLSSVGGVVGSGHIDFYAVDWVTSIATDNIRLLIIITSYTSPPVPGATGLGIQGWAVTFASMVGVDVATAGIIMSLIALGITILPLAFVGLPPVGIIGFMIILVAMFTGLTWLPLWVGAVICIGFSVLIAGLIGKL